MEGLIRKLNLEKSGIDCYPHDAQIYCKVDNVDDYAYCGYGKFLKTITDVANYIIEENNSGENPSPIRMNYATLKKIFRGYESENWGSGQHLHGRIVFTEDSYNQEYSLESRTYCLSSDNKAFQPNMGGYSIYAGSLDNSDPCVRLEQYMEEEYAGKGGWKVDYCYLVQKNICNSKKGE